MRLDFLVFIGRFEPFHNGHLAVAQRALELADTLLVLIGSAGKPRTTKNPWSDRERAVMVREALGPEAAARTIVRPLKDHPYNEAAWIAEVQRVVADAVRARTTGGEVRVGLIGQDKDQSSYYLKEFPQWPLTDVRHTAVLSATDIRNHLFADDEGSMLLVEANVPGPVFAMLKAFRAHDAAYAQLKREYDFLRQYRASWAKAPYPPTFVTVDAVLVHSGHVLLVRRKAEPGAGLWALPGGFVEQGETLETACLRELKEETGLKLPRPVLKGALKAQRVFDAPDRSARGRTITHAFHFAIDAGELPAVRAGSDARSARFFPLSEALAMEEALYEDHHAILEHFIGAV
jgi:bifunctional NMN adenylyltransferase/nudix hydrolase